MKNIHLDNIVKNFINNLEVEKPIYEMEADDARRFLAEVQEKDYENLEGFVEDISIFSPTVGDISVSCSFFNKSISHFLNIIYFIFYRIAI